ncbi:alpha/beta hydrolase [Pseudonocardia sp. HH130630-07]|uniref:alpha/beta hydrolase n=1 Tax=Pseudonocardia sp. HH130630-07 TaxID=1690815 RepID=UPI000814C00E|nr:alpha/beta hydrolase [Pseudonocardia sp. HH130630-07]ANY05861.1 dipeptidyl aminopeptidase [Pseudonocardia sp. HH130630-07]
MTIRSTGQSWSLDIALAQGGFDALHPEAKGTMQQLGHDTADFDKVFALVRSGAMLPKAWATIAAQAQERGEHHERLGYARTASDLYARAAVMFGRAQYSVLDPGDARKTALRERCDECVARVGRLRGDTVRRVELPFDGGTIFALLHLPAVPVTGAPAVILGPGMDMIKEGYIAAAERYYTSRGAVALSIEGPGQGETRARGVTVTLDNYERAIGTYADHLAGLDEVDAERIGMFGISMSGYWSLRALARPDNSLRAVAAFEAVSGDFETIFERAQPSFKNNYMYMAGYTDETAFDRDLAQRMPLGDLVARITRPVLLGLGEFDELTPVEDALATYERITAPKEMRVYEDEFHPLGGTAAEVFAFGAEWLVRALDGTFDTPGRDERFFVHRDGRTTDGTADPRWRLGAAPSALTAARTPARQPSSHGAVRLH